MGGWIAGGVVAALLLLLLCTDVQVRVLWHEALSVHLRIGILRWTVYPLKKAEKERKPKGTKAEESETPSQAEDEARGPNRRQIFYILETLPPILWRALGRLRRKLVIDPLKLAVAFGGEDPADTAILCGRCQALAGALLPWMEQVVTIRNLSVCLQVDFEAEHTRGSGEFGVRLRIGQLLALLFWILGSFLGWYRGYRRLAEPDEKKDKQANAA